jgi:transcriptional regulator with XRE-family HTH domain
MNALAQLTGCSLGYLSLIERGQNALSCMFIVAIASKLAVTEQWILAAAGPRDIDHPPLSPSRARLSKLLQAQTAWWTTAV